MSARKILIFGLDAGEWTLVRRFMDEGHMPMFAALRDRGASGTLTTTAAQLPDTVWSCIYGGRNPATFDKYFYVQYDRRTKDLRHVSDSGFTDRPFWDLLAAHGRKVGVVDAVKFPCSQKLGDGFMISNWGAHATKTPRLSWPRDLLGEADRRFGRNPVGDVDALTDTTSERRNMHDKLLRGVAMRGELVRWLMTERPWDTLFVGFSEMHQSGHFYWHGVDPHHPRHAEIVEQGLADTMQEVYSAIDREIASFLELAGDDPLVLIVAGHGMGPLYHASWNVPDMLDLWGYGPRPARRAAPEHKAKVNPWRVLKKVLPGGLQYAIKNALPQRWQDELLFRWYAGDRDWDGWRAFAVPNNDSVAAIRIAVKGRDADGLVQPGAEYEAVCADLQAAFEELTDPKTGRKVAAQVTRLRDVFRGDYLEDKPDLCVLWDVSFPWHAVESPRFGQLALKLFDARTGSHTPRGFFIAAGAELPERVWLEGHSIYDIAPTVLAAAGVPVPVELEGQSLPILRSAVRT